MERVQYMVTIKTIAEQCGLSIAAVSKALNHRPGISPENAELVRKTAQELGYYPNAAARTLKTNRSHNLGILFQNGMLEKAAPYATLEDPFVRKGNPRFCTQYNNSETGENIGPMYAKTDAEFEQIVSQMRTSCDGYGYDDCVEWCRNEAAKRFSLQ